jgi:DNA-binding NarL/FixJ family response regulator
MKNATIALADDHVLLRNGLANLLKGLDYQVLFEADNGRELIDKLNTHDLPEIVLMDVNMPEMDGYDTTLWLKKNHPDVKVLALSMYDDENAIIRMLKSGAKGYILKDSHPSELKAAIEAILTKGFYHSELVSSKLINTINHLDDPENSSARQMLGLNEREVEFLKLVCTEMTYKEIAEQMNVSVRTVDGYRDGLFDKLDCKSRVGLVLFAIKNGIVVF